MLMSFDEAARARFHNQAGHYESWFLRANAPTGEEALWIRYTIFSPKEGAAEGELWAIYFGPDAPVTGYERFPIADCSFAHTGLQTQIGSAVLGANHASGACASEAAGNLFWELTFDPIDATPLLLLAERFYKLPFPRAKSLVLNPRLRLLGHLCVGQERIDVSGWVGSLNHNWGREHTNRYAWGQVVEFDGADNLFLEVSTAKVKLGPTSTPWLTPLVVRRGDEEFRFSTLAQAVRNHGNYGATAEGLPGDTRMPRWVFKASRGRGKKRIEVAGSISAPRESFATLRYRDPAGPDKQCLNTKVASCDLMVKVGEDLKQYRSQKAAFEILSDITE